MLLIYYQKKTPSNDTDFINLTLNYWVNSCGKSECYQRITILDAINNNRDAFGLIKDYFENNTYYTFVDRVAYSKKQDYGYWYTNSKSYFGFVAFKHSIDSVLINLSKVF